MNELWNGTPSMVPRTLTRPRVPKNSTDGGQTTYVQPPLLGLFCNLAVKRLFNIASDSLRSAESAALPRDLGESQIQIVDGFVDLGGALVADGDAIHACILEGETDRKSTRPELQSLRH